MSHLLQKAIEGIRLSPAEALDLLKNTPWTQVAEAANMVRHRINPGNRVGYTAFRIVNYTNVCEITCSFCSFCRPAKSPEAYVLSLGEIRQKTQEAKAKGADQIFLQGGVNRDIPLSYYTDVLKMLTREMGVKVRGFSPVELVRIAEFNHMELDDLLDVLKAAGLSSVPGAGAEILSDRMRQIMSNSITEKAPRQAMVRYPCRLPQDGAARQRQHRIRQRGNARRNHRAFGLRAQHARHRTWFQEFCGVDLPASNGQVPD